MEFLPPSSDLSSLTGLLQVIANPKAAQDQIKNLVKASDQFSKQAEEAKAILAQHEKTKAEAEAKLAQLEKERQEFEDIKATGVAIHNKRAEDLSKQSSELSALSVDLSNREKAHEALVKAKVEELTRRESEVSHKDQHLTRLINDNTSLNSSLKDKIAILQKALNDIK